MSTLGERARLYTEFARAMGELPVLFEMGLVTRCMLCGVSVAAIVAVLVSVGAPVRAADNSTNVAAVPPSGDSKDIEEIVVTARRQAESLSRVPGSVSAIDTKTLD